MKPATWPRIRALFESVLELPEAERGAAVRREAGGEREVELEVLRLLGHSGAGERLLDPPTRMRFAAAFDPAAIAPGDRVGRYRVERVLGRGGMGTVYEASQRAPSRSVALKVMGVALGADAAQRFELEAEALARMRHPGIATIHELGLHHTSAGLELPFFAMELVEDARDLVEYARAEELGLGARLDLVREVCAAVHHAHQRGVIHRDLKPSNVLVDRAGRAKVIDYGVARHTTAERPGVETQPGHVLGTLQYCSPEQLAGDARDVDLRADVYALGVMLYELVAGRRPYAVEQRPLAEVVAEVCERDPPPPSAHAPGLPRELDWIAARALAKDRERRYGSAAELALDLERLARHEPVSAGPETAGYRARKFVRRHRVAVAAGSLALASLLAGAIATGLALKQADERRVQAERAGRRKEAVVTAVGDWIRGVAPEQEGRDVTLVEMLDKSRGTLEQLADEPEVRAELLSFLTTAYGLVGAYDRCGEVAQAGLAALDSLPAPDRRQRADLLLALTSVRMMDMRLDEADGLLERAFEDLRACGESEVEALILRAELLEKGGRLEESLEAYREAIRRAEAELGPDAETTLKAMSQCGQLALGTGRPEEAEELLASAHARAVAAWGEGHPSTLPIATRYGMVLSGLGEREAAVALQLRGVAGVTAFFGETHRNTLVTRAALAMALLENGELERAAAEARAALELALEHYPDDAELEVYISGPLSNALGLLGRWAESAEVFAATVEAMEGGDFASHPRLVQAHLRLGEIHHKLGRMGEAERELRAGLELAERILEPSHLERLRLGGQLGRVLLDLGRPAEAAPALRQAVDGLVALGADPEGGQLLRFFLPALVSACAGAGLEADRARYAALLEELP